MGKALRGGAGEGRGRGGAGIAGNGEQGTGEAGTGNRERGTGTRAPLTAPILPAGDEPLGLPRDPRFPSARLRRAPARSRFPLRPLRPLLAALFLLLPSAARAQSVRLDHGRFTVIAYPSDEQLAKSLLAAAVSNDTFPGLPRPRAAVVIAVAPDRRRFREWIGPYAPEWGAAIAFPESNRIVMQGRTAGSDAGDPIAVLRHELAHLALHEALGDLPPRWFDEGYASYAANEVARDAVLAANLALLLRGMPSLDSLDAGFEGSAMRAEGSYALAYRAVAELAARDPERGLTLFFRYWKETGRFDRALRSAYGVTQVEFERIWQTRTRRRYGGLALFANLSVAAALTLFLVLPFYVIRRRRDRLRMAALVRADEEAERREAESAIDALLRSIPLPSRGSDDAAPDRPPQRGTSSSPLDDDPLPGSQPPTPPSTPPGPPPGPPLGGPPGSPPSHGSSHTPES